MALYYLDSFVLLSESPCFHTFLSTILLARTSLYLLLHHRTRREFWGIGTTSRLLASLITFAAPKVVLAIYLKTATLSFTPPLALKSQYLASRVYILVHVPLLFDIVSPLTFSSPPHSIPLHTADSFDACTATVGSETAISSNAWAWSRSGVSAALLEAGSRVPVIRSGEIAERERSSSAQYARYRWRVEGERASHPQRAMPRMLPLVVVPAPLAFVKVLLSILSPFSCIVFSHLFMTPAPTHQRLPCSHLFPPLSP
ncbi:hypothetical protein R3P38DRAFT_3223205 [Favolaschia claudopus]|uniref:Uncharacterized protein n=1 Tax=Favolaschia claudopus TaxID=2862362 RepID=A0AAV9ZXG0_9AGAR